MKLQEAQTLWDAKPGWLNTASYGLPPRPAWDALQDSLQQWRTGTGSWETWSEATERSRASVARLLGVEVEDVFMGSTVSAAVGLLANVVPDAAKVLVPEVEFTSNVFPWAVQAHRGIEVATAPAAELPARVDPSVDVVAVSAVQSATGEVADLHALHAAAEAAGALLVVDATQGAGWLPLRGIRADAVVFSTYKWLMAPRGVTFGYLAPHLQERITPAQSGWFAGVDPHDSYYGLPLRLAEDARRFDQSPAWFSHVGGAPALELVEEIGVEQIHHHDVALANRFRTGLGMPPSNSAIVSADVPRAEERLTAAGLRASVRGGRVRVSFHVYSTEADVDAALNALVG